MEKENSRRGCERKIDIFKRQRWMPSSRFRRKLKLIFRLKRISFSSLGRGDASSSNRRCQGIEGVKEIVKIVRKIDFDWSDNL